MSWAFVGRPRGISSAAARTKPSRPALTSEIDALPGIGCIARTPVVRTYRTLFAKMILRDSSINAVSPPWVKETMVKFGMDPSPGQAAADVAKAYVAAVEGKHQGQILDPRLGRA